MQPASCQDADNTARGAKNLTASAGMELAQGPLGKRLPPPRASLKAAQAEKKKRKKKREGRRWSVLHSLFRNQVHLGNRCCCCNKPGTTGCSVSFSQVRAGRKWPWSSCRGCPCGWDMLPLQSKPLVQLHSQTGRAATVLDQLVLCTLHPSHP